ncbi:MAG: DUF1501 domain-containing protein, partial [Pirellulales bacterium]
MLRVGALSALGLSVSDVARLRAMSPSTTAVEKRRRNSCVFLFLFGGPSHIDLWDMKPDAPAEVRGEFRPVATRVAGIQVCEHLPRFAGVMDKVVLLRSMTHRMNVHGPACSEVFSGREYFGPPTTDQARREDWPSLSAMMMRYGASHAGLPSSVVLPWYLQFPGQPKRIAGQTGGRMGEQHNAFLLEGDVSKADFEMPGLKLSGDVPIERVRSRRELLTDLNYTQPSDASLSFGGHRETAYWLLSNQAGEVFDLRRETAATRELYGQTTVGQSLLL